MFLIFMISKIILKCNQFKSKIVRLQVNFVDNKNKLILKDFIIGNSNNKISFQNLTFYSSSMSNAFDLTSNNFVMISDLSISNNSMEIIIGT